MCSLEGGKNTEAENPFERMSTRELVKDQFGRYKKYIKSTLYKKHLLKELTIDDIGLGDAEKLFIEVPVKGIFFVDKVKKYVYAAHGELIYDGKGLTLLERSFKSLSQEQLFVLKGIFDQKFFDERSGHKNLGTVQTINANSDYNTQAQAIIQKRLAIVNSTKVHYMNEKKGFGQALPRGMPQDYIQEAFPGKGYKAGDMIISSDLQHQYSIPLHELVHLSTDGNTGLVPSSEYLLRGTHTNTSSYNYYKSGSEVYARLITLKYYAHTLGIYNAYTQELTKTHLQKLQSYAFIMHDTDMKDLLEKLYIGDEETVLGLTHLIADISPASTDNKAS